MEKESLPSAKPNRKLRGDMPKMKAEALAWAKGALANLLAKGWTKQRASDYILSEVGREWNLGCQFDVHDKLDLEYAVPDATDEEIDPDEEEND